MGNEGQQPPQLPQPQQGAPEQPEYYGWQYEQDNAGSMPLQPSASPQPQPNLPPQPQPNPPVQVPPTPPHHVFGHEERKPYSWRWARGAARQQQQSSRYQEPVADMGSSLGYGQGMEYQYFDAPQPSQPLPMLRQTRLQQLREERLRRQQHNRSDGFAPFRGVQRPPEAGKPFPSPPAQMSPSWDSGVPPSPALPLSPVEYSPVFLPPTEVSPVRAPTPPPPIRRGQAGPPFGVGNNAPPDVSPAQDTGMLQKARIGRATLILTGAFVASRVLGLVRTSLFAYIFGTGATSDAFLQAFLIPDLIFNIIAGGALSSAFIPIFTKYLVGENDEKTAWHVASAALNLAIAIMVVLALVAAIFAGQIIPLYNPKTASITQHDYLIHIALITSLARIMLLQAIILGGGVIVNAVLNAKQNFLLPAIGTVLYNVGLIAGLLFGILLAHGQRNSTTLTTAVYAATWGVVLGAILQVAIQIPGLLSIHMRYSFTLDRHHPGVIQIGRQMIPRIINAGMLYFSIFVDRYLISLLGNVVVSALVLNGLITQYYQALQLLLLPLGIFGMAVSTAAFPTLAENVARGRLDRVSNVILETLRSILYLSIPSSVGLIVLGLPIIQVLLQHGQFTLDNAQATTFPLAGFAIGLAGLAAVEILTRSFYALRDSTTPVIVSVGQFLFKISLSLILINVAVWGPQWGTAALAFSTSIAGLLEAVVLLWLLHQRIGGLQLRLLAHYVGRILLASLAMGVGILIVRFILDFILVTTHPGQVLSYTGTFMALIKLLLEMFVGVLLYIRVSRMLGIEELGPVRRVLDRLKLSWI